MRNDAAHGGEFEYEQRAIADALETVRGAIDRIMRQ